MTKNLVRDLYRYIWKISARDQVLLSILSVGVFLLELAPLELQRRIVNGAVAHHREYRSIALLCVVYLAVSLLHGGLKLVTNVYRGSVSENDQPAPAHADCAGGRSGDAKRSRRRCRRQDLDRSFRRPRRSADSPAPASPSRC